VTNFRVKMSKLIKLNILPEFIDPVFAKTSPKRSFLVIENERYRLVFAKTGSINSGVVLSISIIGFSSY
jgi:hypothetical protein